MVVDRNLSCVSISSLDALTRYINYFNYEIIETYFDSHLIKFSDIQKIENVYDDISIKTLYVDSLIIDMLMISIQIGDYDIIQINDFILCGVSVIPDYIRNWYIVTFKIIIKV